MRSKKFLLFIIFMMGVWFLPSKPEALTVAQYKQKINAILSEWENKPFNPDNWGYGHNSYYACPNSGYGAWECLAFARYVQHQLYGNCDHDGTFQILYSENINSIDDLRVGDTIRYNSGYNPHSIIIIDTDKANDTIRILDCNSHYDDHIVRTHYINFQTLKNYLNTSMANYGEGRAYLMRERGNTVKNLVEKKPTYKPSGSIQNLGTGFIAYIAPKAKQSLVFEAKGTGNASAITLQSKSNNDAQLWKFERRTSDGSYLIINQKTGLVIDISAEGNNNYELIYVWKKNSGKKDYWYIYNYNGGYRFVPESSKKDMRAIDIPGRNYSSGVQPILYEAQDSTNEAQTFVILKVPTSVSLNTSSVSIEKGKTYTLKATINPTDVADKTLKWTSNNQSVATVSTSGVVTAKAKGTATITVTTSNGKTAKATVTVTNAITGVTLNKSNLTLEKGKTETLKATITPSDTTSSKTLNWKSSNESVATVNSSGVVTAKATGTTTITVTTSNGKTAKATVTVTSAITGVTLNKGSLTLEKGKTETLKATITPSDTTSSKTLTWKSSNESVATVNSSGVVTAKAKGTTTITVTTSNGKTAQITVTVTVPETETPKQEPESKEETKEEKQEEKKEEQPTLSNNTNLKKVTIDGKNIEIQETMEYKTTEENVQIEITAEDTKTTVTVENKKLELGQNEIAIKVKAEDGTEKIYTIQIERKENLSNNTNVTIYADGKKIDWKDNKAELKVDKKKTNLDYTYELEDETTKVEVDKENKLSHGKNKVTFRVIAEDGTTAIYQLTVTKPWNNLYIIIPAGCLLTLLVIVFIVKNMKSDKK